MLKYSLDSELDASDKAILEILQNDGRISNVDLAERVHLSPPATHARLKRLEKEGYIAKYVAILDKDKMALGNIVFVEISLELHQHAKIQTVLTKIKAMPEVMEFYHLTGERDYLLKGFIRDTKALEELITQKLTPLPGMAKIRTSLVLNEIKVSTAIHFD